VRRGIIPEFLRHFVEGGKVKKKNVIAIDGPAGAGKSTIAKIVAGKLGYLYIDTGAMYRAVTWKALEEKTDLDDIDAVVALARKTDIELKNSGGSLSVFVDGRDVSAAIRKESISRHTNEIASLGGVRNILRQKQQEMGARGGVVMEGRDIGTCVFPDAKYKFYLDASIDERARRRYNQLLKKGEKVNLAKIKSAIAERDYKDKNRGINPLKRAEDAEVIDSTHLGLKEVAKVIFDYVRNKKK
jgi:cytidylate kinase